MSQETQNKAEYIVIFISEFARRFGLSAVQAYRYLNRYKAMSWRGASMKLYHGTNTDFQAIDLRQSQRGKDFGCGFYLSESETQAEAMANFKVQLFGGQSIVQRYEFDEARLDDGTLRFMRFDGYTRDWATFILANRQNKNAKNIHDYDVVYGPIANDKVGAQIRNVIEQNINMETFLERLKYMKGITFQYFFGSEKAIQMLRRL